MNKTLLSLFTAVASLTVSAPAVAQSNIDHHIRLVKAVKETGVRFYINPPACDEKRVYGWYSAANNELVVCQENRIRYSSRPVDWTEEDLDTLRHEAHHVVQDCMDGTLQGNLGIVYKDPLELGVDVLGRDGVVKVVEMYEAAPDKTKVLEVEAFAVAAMNDPLEQVSDVYRYCF